MKFDDLIKTNSWLSVEIVFLQLYPDEINQIPEYENVFNDLRQLYPVDTDISIVISHEIDEFDNQEYRSVSGLYNDPQKSANDFSASLALEFTPWNQWLGMNIDKNTLQEFTELEIICHCLFEMTFFSFDQKEIENEITRIKDIADEYKKMTGEQKKGKLFSLDDLINKYRSNRKNKEN